MDAIPAYGDEIAGAFRLQKAPSISTTVRPGAFFAATLMQCGEEGLGKTLPIPRQPAYIVCVLYRPLVHELWLGSKPIPVGHLPIGTVSSVSLEDEPTAYYGGRLESLQIYIPNHSLDAMADDEDSRVVRELRIPPGTVDPVAYQLSLILRPALERPEQASLLFVSGLMEAFYGHLSMRYGDASFGLRTFKGGLSARQLARAKELIDANLSGALSVETLARECGMSPNHFSRAFKQSSGVPPHRWLLLRRVEVAMSLMERGELSMREVAAATGFADQSHLIRVFSRIVGLTPKAWNDSRSR
ncbi:AraC-like DNA-binding protein [Paraburkholderia sp. BL18I3N2]|uniref:AraC family transcriptional regulator n=1 Tax=Paraburkholderia sp. BL18I3N2 TaxID=1938799 RepID=UPI000D08181F|nr:AraC family transcriptional regulator [Paraburkholderia sp. BL18I3N2]PRX24135.1 AraC-like DNA-binding protein [Paraburkholderia sp. BL18I3N2]